MGFSDQVADHFFLNFAEFVFTGSRGISLPGRGLFLSEFAEFVFTGSHEIF